MALWAEYKTAEMQAETLAGLVAAQLADAIAKNGRATLAVPGGTTPGPFLKALSGANIEWKSVRVMLTDERFVPESSERSNTRLLKDTLFQGPAKAATLVPMTEVADAPEDVLDKLTSAISEALPLDVCVLGMGADKHIASLFPGADQLSAALEMNGQDVIFAMRAPGAPEPRITLSAPVLAAAKKVHLLIIGPEKLAALRSAEQPGPLADAPVRVILNHAADVTVHYCETGPAK